MGLVLLPCLFQESIKETSMGLGGTEIVILLVLVLLFFGGKRLPQLGSALGKAMTNFKSGLKDKDDKEV